MHGNLGKPPRTLTEAADDLAATLRAEGFVLRGTPVFDDRIHRVDVEGKPGGKDGAYRATVENGRAFGWYQNWREHSEPVSWHSAPTDRIAPADRDRLQEAMRLRRVQRAQEQAARHEEASSTAYGLWGAAKRVQWHPYLKSKGVPSFGLRQGAPGQAITLTREDGSPRNVDLAGQLFVPMYDTAGKLWSLQFVAKDGFKQFLQSGRVEGCHFIIGDTKRPSPLIIAEGYATAATVHELSGIPTIAAFNAGNLMVVAKAVRTDHPERRMFIAADNDHARERQVDKHGRPKLNIGKLKAEEAAASVGAGVLMPNFEAGADDSLSDWNDVIAARGRDEARRQFALALIIAEREIPAVRSARKL